MVSRPSTSVSSMTVITAAPAVSPSPAVGGRILFEVDAKELARALRVCGR